jgi:hypothetical protein
MNRPEMPESTKMLQVKDVSQAIGEFLEWLSEQRIRLASYTNWDEPILVEINESFERLLARYFDIDLNKVEQEKRTLLDWIRSQPDDVNAGEE